MPRIAAKALQTALATLCLGAAAVASPPTVVSCLPDHGDAGVDPALKTIRVEFDQEMAAQGHSVCGGPRMPTLTGKPVWESPRVLLIPVALAGGREYELSINCPSANNFKNAAGEPAEITPIFFRTAADGAAPTAQVELSRDENERALDALAKAIDERYAYRNRVVKDWKALLDDLRLEAAPAPTPGAFARSVARALGAAQDPHIALRIGTAPVGTIRSTVTPNCDPRRLEKVIPGFNRQGIFATGRFDDGVGYLAVFAWPSDSASLDGAVQAVKAMADAPGMIIDVRLNGGGDEVAARRIASLFTRARTVYSRNHFRDPSQPEGWGKMLVRSIAPADGAAPYAGKVAVLIGPACMSSNESFILMMKHGGKATLVGDRTRGSSGNPKPHDLGNGVTILLPSWEDFLPDGTALEGNGITPDVKAEFGADAARDGVLDAALSAVRAK